MADKQLSFCDGVADIYTVTNTAPAGDTPNETLSGKRTVRFEYRTVGAVRYFAAMQAEVKIDRIICIPRGASVTPQDIVILSSESASEQYHVKQVQIKTDTKPHSQIISLERVEQVYDVSDI